MAMKRGGWKIIGRVATRKFARLGRRQPLAERFWAKVQKGPDCWTWTGAVSKGQTGRSYGAIQADAPSRQLLVASRVSLEISLGRPLDATENALHRCDNSMCVRPDHLFVGTDRDNTQDMIKKGRHPSMRLTAQQANDIRRRCATESISQSALAREYGVDPSCISKIVNHQRQLEV